MQALLLLQDFSCREMHLALQLLKLLPQAVRRNGVVLRHRLIKGSNGIIGISLERRDCSFQARYRQARALACFEDGVGGKCGSSGD